MTKKQAVRPADSITRRALSLQAGPNFMKRFISTLLFCLLLIPATHVFAKDVTVHARVVDVSFDPSKTNDTFFTLEEDASSDEKKYLNGKRVKFNVIFPLALVDEHEALFNKDFKKGVDYFKVARYAACISEFIFKKMLLHQPYNDLPFIIKVDLQKKEIHDFYFQS